MTARVAHLNIMGLCGGQLLPVSCPPAFGLDGLITDATALPVPTGVTQITIVVADDTTFVEHPGNAGRPQAAAVNRPIASVHRPSGWSRSYVLASLRALG
jgi:hypothetical protein